MEIIPYMDPMGNNLNLEVWLLPASREVSFCPLCFFRLLRSCIRNSLRPTRSMVQRVMIPNFGDNQLIFTSLDLPNSNMSPEKRFFAILEALEKTIFWFDISFLPWFLLKVKLAYLLKKKTHQGAVVNGFLQTTVGQALMKYPNLGDHLDRSHYVCHCHIIGSCLNSASQWKMKVNIK